MKSKMIGAFVCLFVLGLSSAAQAHIADFTILPKHPYVDDSEITVQFGDGPTTAAPRIGSRPMRSLLCIAILATFALAGCGSSSKPSTSTANGNNTTHAETTTGTTATTQTIAKPTPGQEHIEREEAAAKNTEERALRHETEAPKKLLNHKGAKGMTQAQVEHELGPPESTQEVNGTVFLYYHGEAEGNIESLRFQLVIEGGRVTQVNHYGE